jgi:hypothetical protein
MADKQTALVVGQTVYEVTGDGWWSDIEKRYIPSPQVYSLLVVGVCPNGDPLVWGGKSGGVKRIALAKVLTTGEAAMAEAQNVISRGK